MINWNLYDVAKPAPKGQWIAINSYIREKKAEKQWSNILSQETEKENQIKSQSGRTKKTMEVTAEIKKYKTNTQEKNNK